MLKKGSEKVPFKYVCNKCDYYTNRKSQYDRHLQTIKHNAKNAISNAIEKVPFVCECGKVYKQQPSLSRHKKTCTYIQEGTSTQVESIELSRQTIDTSALATLLMKLIDTNENLREEIIELASKPRNVTNNFNLNNFLNIDCKDAMNLSDFMDSITLTFKDLLYVGNNGFINSFRDSFIRSLKTLEKTKRPIHCTDLKRKTLKVKDNDIWETDKDGEKVKKSIDQFSRKQLIAYKHHHQQRDEDFLDDDTNFDNNNKIILGMCEYTNESSENIKKQLLREISNTTTIQKEN